MAATTPDTWEGGEVVEEAITVNQRALIDKILARYAAEFTLLRELLQNADDAEAHTCRLLFSSRPKASPRTEAVVQRIRPPSHAPFVSEEPSAHPNEDIDLAAPLHHWIFQNDGKAFSPDDWNRLRRIAEGNPDPDRIGAFGVGFYSLFSICEEPIVSSGGTAIGFFWKGDSLYTRRSARPPQPSDNIAPEDEDLNAETQRGWTTFHMRLREASVLPETALKLCEFLTTSLAFTANVRTVEVYWNGHPLLHAHKQLSPADIIKWDSRLSPASPEGMMRADALHATPVKIMGKVAWAVLRDEEKRRRAKESLITSIARKISAATSGDASAAVPAAGPAGFFSNALGSSIGGFFKKAFIPESVSTPTRKEIPSKVEPEPEEQPSPPPPPPPVNAPSDLDLVQADVHLRVATATISTRLDRTFVRELERSTKKPPPTTTKLSIIYAGKEDRDRSLVLASGAKDLPEGLGELFSGLLPHLSGSGAMGRVFIGFRTHQTTSFGGHVAARLIPTVERESLDFIDRYCAKWNMELLAMAAWVARAVYENEIDSIRRRWTQALGEDARWGYAELAPASGYEADTATTKAKREVGQRLFDEALHLMRFFSFGSSTPSARVGEVMAERFFACSKWTSLALLSTAGVKMNSTVRWPNKVLSGFVKRAPVLLEEHITGAPAFMTVLKERGMVRDLLVEDVMQELASRPLEPDEMVACLQWWSGVSHHAQYATQFQSRLVRTAVVRVPPALGAANGHPDSETVQPLHSISYWRNPSRVPPHLPVPNSCLPIQVSQALSVTEMASVMGWKELPLPTWVEFIVELSGGDAKVDVTQNPEFAQQIFTTLARAWGNIKAETVQAITTTLTHVACIPTLSPKGSAYVFKRPGEAYFSSVALFEDLPIAHFPNAVVKGSLEKVLAALGVRRHVELQLIFDRLVSRGNWSHVELITYLAENQKSLTSTEWARLKKTAMLPAEAPAEPKEEGSTKRHFPSELYEPTPVHRALGLPVLSWPGKVWRPNSEEAKLLFAIGLVRNPKLETLIALASGSNETVRTQALTYLVDRFQEVYATSWPRDLKALDRFAFIPCLVPAAPEEGRDGRQTAQLRQVLRPPSQAYTNAGATVLGFAAVDNDLLRQMGGNLSLLPALLTLPHHPAPAALIEQLLRQGTTDEHAARKRFEYLATVSEFSLRDYAQLSRAPFVPVRRRRSEKEAEVVLSAPSNCFFAPRTTTEGNDVIPRDLFLYCDFGPVAGAFLKNCGVSDRPSAEQVATKLVVDPSAFYTAMNGVEQYTSLLRLVAAAYSSFPKQLRAQMRTSPFLLASRRVLADNEEEEEGTLLYDLRCAQEIVRVDEASSFMLFASVLFAAPYEEALSTFYEQLGSPRLSSLMNEQFSTLGTAMANTPFANDVQTIILERTPLFLYEKASTVRSEFRGDPHLKDRLQVLEVNGSGLRLTRTLNFGAVHETNVQAASARATAVGSTWGRGGMKLEVASNMPVDWFEVAQQLCPLLLSHAGRNLEEILLFMTLLSTPLRDLRRRGFHVDKILAARRVQREAAERELKAAKQAEREHAEQERERLKQLALSSSKNAEKLPKHDERNGAPPSHESGKTDANVNFKAATAVDTSKPSPLQRDSESSSISGKKASNGEERMPVARAPSSAGLLHQLRSRWNPSQPLSSLANGTSSIVRDKLASGSGSHSGQLPPATPSVGGGHSSTPAPGIGGPMSTTGKEVTPMDQIRANARNAVQVSDGSRKGGTPRVPNPTDSRGQNEVREAAEGYCDVSGSMEGLHLAGRVGGLRFYAASEVNVASVLTEGSETRAALDRLIAQVYRPVAQVFDLPADALCVFLDLSGPTIAFNQGGVIYLNLRFYIAWHDALVRHGALTEPIVSTFFTLAHELAHNVEHAHNAQHEFYFSAIAEQFLPQLVRLL